jgi:hypothetical protein
MPDLIDTQTPQDARARTGSTVKPMTSSFPTSSTPLYGRFTLVSSSRPASSPPANRPSPQATTPFAGLSTFGMALQTTRDGTPHHHLNSTVTTQSGLTPGKYLSCFRFGFDTQFIRLCSTAPFQTSDNHNQTYRSGILQLWFYEWLYRGCSDAAGAG